jgi:hypothetical protein
VGRPLGRLHFLAAKQKKSPGLAGFYLAMGVLIAGAFGLAHICVFFGISSHHDVADYWQMHNKCPPVWKKLALRRIYLGQPVEEAMAEAAPTRVATYAEKMTLYYEGAPALVTIKAKDGVVISATASTCPWQRWFFGSDTYDVATLHRGMAELSYDWRWRCQ